MYLQKVLGIPVTLNVWELIIKDREAHQTMAKLGK